MDQALSIVGQWALIGAPNSTVSGTGEAMWAIAGRLGRGMAGLDTHRTMARCIHGGRDSTRIHLFHIRFMGTHLIIDFAPITSPGIAIPGEGMHGLTSTGTTEFSVSCQV